MVFYEGHRRFPSIRTFDLRGYEQTSEIGNERNKTLSPGTR